MPGRAADDRRGGAARAAGRAVRRRRRRGLRAAGGAAGDVRRDGRARVRERRAVCRSPASGDGREPGAGVRADARRHGRSSLRGFDHFALRRQLTRSGGRRLGCPAVPLSRAIMSTIIEVHAREILDSRGNPDRRGRCGPRRAARRGGPRCRAAPPPASTRRSSCATAMPSATSGRACIEAVRNVNEVLGPTARGHGGGRPDRGRRRDDGRRRHAQQEQARRQRHPQRVARRGARGRRRIAGCRSTATSAARWRGCCRCR